jgi:hypothetical protein
MLINIKKNGSIVSNVISDVYVARGSLVVKALGYTPGSRPDEVRF